MLLLFLRIHRRPFAQPQFAQSQFLRVQDGRRDGEDGLGGGAGRWIFLPLTASRLARAGRGRGAKRFERRTAVRRAVHAHLRSADAGRTDWP